MTGPDLRAELEAVALAIRADAAARDPWLAELPVVGVGWATVDLERAIGELAALGPFTAVTRDATLGAAARRAQAAQPRGAAVLVLEPDTEGLLAASVARFGEGVLVAWLGPLERADIDDTPMLGPSRAGPLGPARLVIGRPAWGPHAFVLAGAARRGRTA
jgi:hypothetical protein